MSGVIEGLALFLVALGLAIFLGAMASTKNVAASAMMMLDLWTAAGLLRLSGMPNWASLAIVAVIIIMRKIVVKALRVGVQKK